MKPVAATVIPPQAPMQPFEDGVQPSSVTLGQTSPGVVKTAHGPLLPDGAVNTSRGGTLSLTTPLAPKRVTDTVEVPSDFKGWCPSKDIPSILPKACVEARVDQLT
ncbi:hypothetical protein HPB50_012835 [Hyalomma asiaticum]|uniref:Uncharacterized protein n=1 Tax=Hyalomma asiaticum TaxID=266040 RepID=A0ACB7RSQ2_HYAAI|nr:hypothetical protein HPB50_012835 [Hyalomma asiaticum]